MFNKYSFTISKIFKKAEEEMFNLHHPYVGSEHLLLSLLKYDKEIIQIATKYNLTYDNFIWTEWILPTATSRCSNR